MLLNMFDSQSLKAMTILLLFVLVTSCVLGDHVTGSSVSMEKRAIRRYPRAKYRVGYMFGKRSSSVPESSILFDIISRNLVTKADLESLIKKNHHVVKEIATILDKNGDGFISASDLL